MRLPIGLAACRRLGNNITTRSLQPTRSQWLRPASKGVVRFSSATTPKDITVSGKTYKTDSWLNTPPSILSAIPRRLHLQPDHPISLTRQLIESRFPGYKTHNELFPIVSVQQNFDSLDFPPDHVGRSRTDTYYVNQDTVLRTHTSAHQADTFRANESEGYLISADVYRRDAIDRSHYPVFHQMEGARTWSRDSASSDSPSTLVKQIWDDVSKIPTHPSTTITVEDPNPTHHPDRNPLQSTHSPEEIEAISTHLKRSLEDVVVAIFTAAQSTTTTTSPSSPSPEPLKVRWVEAYFPFTTPSWELEVFWQNTWLEVLGCGVVQHSILRNSGVSHRLGWAFGIGLERIAMLLYGIPDIRLFWSTDSRFLSQFRADQPMKRFVPFSKFPACFKDVSFWLPQSSPPPPSASASPPSPPPSNVSPAGGNTTTTTNPPQPTTPQPTPTPTFHENDVMQTARNVAGDLIESIDLVDTFTHPKTGRQSMCYRVNYRSLERTLTNEEINALHEQLGAELVGELGVELR